MKFSVVIAAKNEEKALGAALESVRFADQILVIDDESTDKTAQIARSFGAKVHRRKLDGFATQKNFGIDKADHDWILILDADERVSATLARELQELKPSQEITAYSMPFKNYIGDKWLAHGGLYPDRHVRFFNRRQARYGQREIHEELEITQGRVAELNGDVIHFTYATLSEYAAKVRRYATQEAGLASRPPSWPTIIKEFIRRYILLRGFLDGYYGLASAYLLAYYQYLLRQGARR